MSGQIRLYGHKKGNGSWARVTDGLLYGLRAHGFQVATHYIDADDEQELGDEPIAIYVGAPAGWPRLTSFGEHRERWVVLAPNSSWMPPQLMEVLPRYATMVLAPSQWAALVLRQHTELPIWVVGHGVRAGEFSRGHKVFTTARRMMEDKIARFERGSDPFRVLHFTSSDRQRKGTLELVEAWRRLVAGRRAMELTIVADYDMRGVVVDEYVRVVPRWDLSLGELDVGVQHYHIVCQPSRAEGFGLCPLEALAAGVPVVATTCTGHAEYLVGTRAWAGCAVPHTALGAPIDDGPGALAPSFDPADLEAALLHAYSNSGSLTRQAFWQAPAIAEEWDWGAVLFRYGLDTKIRRSLEG